jgi:hypothetical protein
MHWARKPRTQRSGNVLIACLGVQRENDLNQILDHVMSTVTTTTRGRVYYMYK